MTSVTIQSIAEALSAHVPKRADSTGRREAAVAIVLAPGARGELELLFIKRASVDGDPWSGQMAFPGGRRDGSDEDLLATAVRETYEETQVALTRDTLLGTLDDLAPVTPVLPPVLVRPFVFGLHRRPGVVPSHEVADFLWADLRSLARTAGSSQVRVRGEQLTVPSVMAGGNVVWGMTHRILKQVLELVQ